MPIGSPLDSSPDFQGGPALPIAAAPTSPPYDVPQPRQRVRGTIELAAPGDEIGDITTSADPRASARSEEHTSELQSLMRISYAVFCLKKKNTIPATQNTTRCYLHRSQECHCDVHQSVLYDIVPE